MRRQVYHIDPVGKPRQTRRDRWARREPVLRYRAFRDECRLHQVVLPASGAHVTFVIPMPRSWSQKRRTAMAGQPHRQKPDADNLAKALMDAVYADDAHVWDLRVTKVWGERGQIIIERIVMEGRAA